MRSSRSSSLCNKSEAILGNMRQSQNKQHKMTQTRAGFIGDLQEGRLGSLGFRLRSAGQLGGIFTHPV